MSLLSHILRIYNLLESIAYFFLWVRHIHLKSFLEWGKGKKGSKSKYLACHEWQLRRRDWTWSYDHLSDKMPKKWLQQRRSPWCWRGHILGIKAFRCSPFILEAVAQASIIRTWLKQIVWTPGASGICISDPGGSNSSKSLEKDMETILLLSHTLREAWLYYNAF